MTHQPVLNQSNLSMDSHVSSTLTREVSLHALGCNPGPDILSCSHLHIFEILNFVVLCNLIASFGVVGNCINMRVFYLQGFHSTVNISFFSMAISDLCCLVTLLWVCVCLNPFIIAAGVPWVPEDIDYLPGGWPHIVSGRITSYITIFITAERCLSIITPLRVKQIITPRRAGVVICLIYIINILTLLPEYLTAYYKFTFFPERNATLLAIAFTSNRDSFGGLTYFINSITGGSSFLGVILWTIILVVKLRESSKWRTQASNVSRVHISVRDKKTVKMVAIIAGILIACYIPGAVILLASYLEPGFSHRGRYVNLTIAVYSFAFVFQSVNSSVNIILYYKMSSNYRKVFGELLGNICKLKPEAIVTGNKTIITTQQ